MRIKITFQVNKFTVIPINYQYFLSSAIYHLLSTSNLDFSTVVHEGKYINGSKKFKWFTFSWLQIPSKQRIICNSNINILPGQIFWFISSPWYEFVQYLMDGLLQVNEIKIGEENFQIVQIETVPNPFKINSKSQYTENLCCQKFICLSPIVVTTKKEYKGRLLKYYYRPSDDNKEISEKIRQNIINKYRAFYKKEVKDDSFEVVFDEKYIKKPDAERKVNYKNIEIKAIMCPFTASGSLELIRFAYECGFGEQNSGGFGMVK